MAKSKILIIDDEENLCFLVKMNLEATGRYEVLTATDPREGLKLAKANIPDLILLDLMMPHMEGSEVAERLMFSTAAAQSSSGVSASLCADTTTTAGAL